MNIIFLDVDGVLNSINNTKAVCKSPREARSGADYPFSVKSLENLKRLVNKTDAKLVICSTWRKKKKKYKCI